MINISLKQLRYFEALASHGHFGRAAESCAISQPALSLQIKELEETIGAPLVERGARHARLTPLGQNFMERAREILQSVEELGDLARASGDYLKGKLRIGMIPTIAPYLFPDVIKGLRRQFPELTLIPREAKTKNLVKELKEGLLDLAVMAIPIDDPALHEQVLFDEEFLLVRPSSQADLPIPSMDTLNEASLLLLEEGHCFRDQALAFCNIPPSGKQVVMEGSSLSTLVQMVGAEIGLSLLPEMAVKVETKSADVHVTHFQTACPNRSIGALWRKTSPLSGHFMQISDAIAEIGKAGKG